MCTHRDNCIIQFQSELSFFIESKIIPKEKYERLNPPITTLCYNSLPSMKDCPYKRSVLLIFYNGSYKYFLGMSCFIVQFVVMQLSHALSTSPCFVFLVFTYSVISFWLFIICLLIIITLPPLVECKECLPPMFLPQSKVPLNVIVEFGGDYHYYY